MHRRPGQTLIRQLMICSVFSFPDWFRRGSREFCKRSGFSCKTLSLLLADWKDGTCVILGDFALADVRPIRRWANRTFVREVFLLQELWVLISNRYPFFSHRSTSGHVRAYARACVCAERAHEREKGGRRRLSGLPGRPQAGLTT